MKTYERDVLRASALFYAPPRSRLTTSTASATRSSTVLSLDRSYLLFTYSRSCTNIRAFFMVSLVYSNNGRYLPQNPQETEYHSFLRYPGQTADLVSPIHGGNLYKAYRVNMRRAGFQCTKCVRNGATGVVVEMALYITFHHASECPARAISASSLTADSVRGLTQGRRLPAE